MSAGELRVNPEGYLHLTWGPGSQSSDAAQALFYEVLHQLQRTGCRKLLTDQRQRVPATEDYMGWLLGIWLPQAAEAHLLTHVAVVHARPLELRLQAIDVCAQGFSRYGIISQFFTTPEEASEWLLSQAGATMPPHLLP
jgi:hypothetical protein